MQRIVANDFLVVLFHPPLLLSLQLPQLLVQSDGFLAFPLKLPLKMAHLHTPNTHIHRSIDFLLLPFLDVRNTALIPPFYFQLSSLQFLDGSLDDLHFEVEIDEPLGLQFQAPLADDVALILLGHYQVVYWGFAAQARNLGHVQQIHWVIIITYKSKDSHRWQS